MRKHLAISGLALLLSGCGLAPGIYVNTNDLKIDRQHVTAEAQPTIIPISSYVTHHRSKYNNCHNNNGSWICENKNAYKYLIGQGDILKVIVYDHPELTNPEGDYRSPEETGIPVNPDGTIDYPFVGKIEVAGKTVEQVATDLTKKIAKYIQSPQISVRVSEFNHQRVQLLGEISKPTTIPITNIPLNLLDALNDGGGVNLSTANGKFIYVIRGPANHPKMFWLDGSDPDALLLAENFYLQNHDVVYVSTAGVARWNRFVSNLVPTVSGLNAGDEAATRK